MLSKSARLCALGSLLILTACATRTTPSPAVIDSFCAVAKPIRFSPAHDTLETIAQVKELNAIGVSKCGWGRAPLAVPPPP